jgi:hypothetical protein
MKQKSRRRLPPALLSRERTQIATFFLDTYTQGGEYISTQSLFDEYKGWLARCNREDSQLTVDGFGRMLPGGYRRRIIIIDGCPACRGMVGIKRK